MNIKNLSKKKKVILGILFVIELISITIIIRYVYSKIVYAQHVDNLEDTYGIYVSIDYPELLELEYEYEVFRANNTMLVNNNLEAISEYLEDLPDGLIEGVGSAAYITDKKEGHFYSSNPLDALESCDTPFILENDIHIILCNALYNKEKENVSGCFFQDEESYYIVLTLKEEGKIAESFYHEIFHAIEDRSAYTKYMMLIDNKEEFEELMQYPHIKEKAQYMSAVMIDVFPSITEDNCFQWQKWLMEMEE